MRLNKYLASAGLCSRREADKLIEAGKVNVNGVVAGLGTPVNDGDEVSVDGKMVKEPVGKGKVVYAFYKPEGVVSTMAKDEEDSLYNYLQRFDIPQRVFPVGRLDKESSGLILLTDDGDLMNSVLKTANNHQKEYVVKVNKDVTDSFLKSMAEGVEITDASTGKKVVTKRCRVRKNGKKTFTIVLTQGLNRQIRRMCGALGYQVLSLKRIRIMNINLGGLGEGEIRKVSREEYDRLCELCNLKQSV